MVQIPFVTPLTTLSLPPFIKPWTTFEIFVINFSSIPFETLARTCFVTAILDTGFKVILLFSPAVDKRFSTLFYNSLAFDYAREDRISN